MPGRSLGSPFPEVYLMVVRLVTRSRSGMWPLNAFGAFGQGRFESLQSHILHSRAGNLNRMREISLRILKVCVVVPLNECLDGPGDSSRTSHEASSEVGVMVSCHICTEPISFYPSGDLRVK